MTRKRVTVHKLICKECGCNFVALNKRAKFHSSACRLKYWRRNKAEKPENERYAVDNEGHVYKIYQIGEKDND